MKKHCVAPWFLVVLILLSFTAAGCGTTKSIYERSKRATRSLYDKVTPSGFDGLRKKLLLLPMVDQAALGEEKTAKLTKAFVSILEKDGSLLVIKEEEPPSPARTLSPELGIGIDPDLAKRAEEMGMNILVKVTINPFEYHKTRTGIWPFRGIKREIETSVSLSALDLINGTLYASGLESRKMGLLEDLMEWEEEDEKELRRNVDEVKLQKALLEMVSDQAEDLVKGLKAQPWSGRIISTTQEGLVISAGRDTGLKAGRVFVVFGKGELIRSSTGRAYHLLGPKVGEIRAVGVMDTHALAAPLGEGNFEAGQVIRTKD